MGLLHIQRSRQCVIPTWPSGSAQPSTRATATDRPGEAEDWLSECRGVVLHIAEGTYAGTIAWGKNPASDVSFHFACAKDGRRAQLVDTDDRAWTQRAGNKGWWSIEFEGYAGQQLTPQQVEFAAEVLVEANRIKGVPIQIATSPAGKGLGHHSMGAENGVDWGHSACPGAPIKAQRAAIVARALVLAGKPDPAPQLVVDGRLNAATIRRWQQIMGTPADGVISKPSSLVKAVQRRLNAAVDAGLTVDGEGIGQDGKVYATARALQRYLGTSQDGRISAPVSEVVKALQRRLNTGKF